MCFVRVILKQLVAGIALQTFVCFFMQFSLSAEELSGTVEERYTAEWVQSAYTTSEWTSLVLLRCFCTPFLFFDSHIFSCHAYSFVWPTWQTLCCPLGSYCMLIWYVIVCCYTYWHQSLYTLPVPSCSQAQAYGLSVVFVCMVYLKWELFFLNTEDQNSYQEMYEARLFHFILLWFVNNYVVLDYCYRQHMLLPYAANAYISMFWLHLGSFHLTAEMYNIPYSQSLLHLLQLSACHGISATQNKYWRQANQVQKMRWNGWKQCMIVTPCILLCIMSWAAIQWCSNVFLLFITECTGWCYLE